MEDDAQEPFEGRCLCGQVRFTARGRPIGIAACHCESCRRQSGAPFAVYADYRADHVRFDGEAPAIYRSSPGAERGFCGRCGATVLFRGANLPEMVHLHIGLFDRAAELAPDGEENIDQRLPWVQPVVAGSA